LVITAQRIEDSEDEDKDAENVDEDSEGVDEDDEDLGEPFLTSYVVTSAELHWCAFIDDELPFFTAIMYRSTRVITIS
jgi:hypothetical protein